MYKKLNLGCAEKIRDGYVNVDFAKQEGVDLVWDLNRTPWPFNDGEVDEIYASHILEHLENFDKIMEEMKRVCKNGAKIRIRVPHFSSGVTYRDPTHKIFFSYFTFDYYTKKSIHYDKGGLRFVSVEKRFLNFTRTEFTFLNPIINPLLNINPKIYERFFCWIFPCSEILFELKVVK